MKDRPLPMTDLQLKDLAGKLAFRAGIDWAMILSQCTEIAVFGSQANGVQTSISDLDILAVVKSGASLPSRIPGMDLVFRNEEQIVSADWLKSELAGHIAVYGRWLHGSSSWRAKALSLLGESFDAAGLKQQRVNRLTEALRRHWARLTPDFRRRNLITLRREKQRLQILKLGFAVPPTRSLDIWAECNSWSQDIPLRALRSRDLEPLLEALNRIGSNDSVIAIQGTF